MKRALQKNLMLFVFCPMYVWADSSITYSDLTLQSSVITAAFYSSAVVLLVVFALFNLSSRNYPGLWYTLLFSIGLLFVACLDGTGRHLIWGDYPFIDRWLPLATLLSLNACGLLLAAHTLDTQSLSFYPALKRLMQVTGYFSLALIILIPVGFQFYLVLWGNIGFLLMVVAQVITTLSWRTPKNNLSEEALRYSGIFSRITSLVFFIATVITGLILWHQSQQDTYSYANFMYVSSRTVYLISSFTLVMTFMAHIIGIQKDRDQALRLELESTRRAALASEEKLQAERDFFRMKELAKQRRQQLSAASHDIRQPLVSLQLTLDKLSQINTVDQRPEYQQALKYISQLSESYTCPEGDFDSSNDDFAEHTETNKVELLPMSLLFKTIQQMFEPEASAKNTELRFVHTDMSALVDPSAVMRIVSNLVSNALAHTQSKKILLGCRRQGRSIDIQVYDQGAGLSQSEFQQMQQLHCRGAASKGQGIGLANCVDIAKKAGYELSLSSTKGKGCRFSLLIPRASQNN